MQRQNEDLYDRLISVSLLKGFRPLLEKYKQGFVYLFFGGVTTLINIAVFWLFYRLFHMNELAANAVAWVVAFIFAFIVNRNYVFEAQTDEKKETARQFLTFLAGRLFSLLCEELILYLFITRLGLLALPVKIFAQIVVVLLNYVISRLFVFRIRRTERIKKI